ncbi:hypothetical protein LINPERHAP2_LOCUS37587 [Linum perenne]
MRRWVVSFSSGNDDGGDGGGGRVAEKGEVKKEVKESMKGRAEIGISPPPPSTEIVDSVAATKIGDFASTAINVRLGSNCRRLRVPLLSTRLRVPHRRLPILIPHSSSGFRFSASPSARNLAGAPAPPQKYIIIADPDPDFATDCSNRFSILHFYVCHCNVNSNTGLSVNIKKTFKSDLKNDTKVVSWMSGEEVSSNPVDTTYESASNIAMTRDTEAVGRTSATATPEVNQNPDTNENDNENDTEAFQPKKRQKKSTVWLSFK